ncbi:DUF5999 family protein [Streptomyces sp.]|uniref:DUF5999 family protein n=1 Tax=Streptomyces sp. TaxID=1931 RepID=UPI0039C96EB9
MIANEPRSSEVQRRSLLCNGIFLFEDTGELLPDGQIIAPHRPTGAIGAGDGDLFIRYMRAFQASTEHLGVCAACQRDARCEDGDVIHGRFASLQDLYEARRQGRLMAV